MKDPGWTSTWAGIEQQGFFWCSDIKNGAYKGKTRPTGISSISVMCGTVVPKSAQNPKVHFVSGPCIYLFCTWGSMPWMALGVYMWLLSPDHILHRMLLTYTLLRPSGFMYSPIILSRAGGCSWRVVITGRCFFHTLLCIAHPQTVPHRWVIMLFVTLRILGEEIEDLVVFKNQTCRSFEDG